MPVKMPIAARMLTAVLCVLFVADLVAIVTLPFLFKGYMAYYYNAPPSDAWKGIQVFLAVVGVLGLWIIGELLFMLRTMPENPFVARNVWALRRVGGAALVTAAVFAVKCVYDMTVLTLLCVFLFLVACLFAFTLAFLFRRAVEYKQENDLTI